jgi:uncharacterized protein
MTVWVDADSCPKPVRDLLIKAADRRMLHMVFVADRKLPLPSSPYIASRIVETGTDHADLEVVAAAKEGDLVITRDIPFAAVLVKSGIKAIDDRGYVFSDDNIGERLSMRNLMYGLREGGIQAERARPASPRDLKAFADAFDREVTKLLKMESRPG